MAMETVSSVKTMSAMSSRLYIYVSHEMVCRLELNMKEQESGGRIKKREQALTVITGTWTFGISGVSICGTCKLPRFWSGTGTVCRGIIGTTSERGFAAQ